MLTSSWLAAGLEKNNEIKRAINLICINLDNVDNIY